jgi:hypothetical protein
LEYFQGKPALAQHLSANPCLSEYFSQVWQRLSNVGWCRVEGSKGEEAGRTLCFVPGFANDYLQVSANKSANNISNSGYAGDVGRTVQSLISSGLVPGIHLFVSKIAMCKYIAR